MRSKTLKIVGTIAVVGALAALAVLNTVSDSPFSTFLAKQNPSDLAAFNSYISKFHKSYITKSEYNARFQNFKAALEFVRSHDASKEGHEVGINHFADWTEEELA